MVIWKKILSFNEFGMAYIECSWDAVLLTVKEQNGKATAWFLNDRHKDQEFKIPVAVVMTGDETKPGYDKYISTIVFDEGRLVLHFFTQEIKQGKYETGGMI